jgi:hypothetical protein
MKPSTLLPLLANAFAHQRKVLIKGAPGIGKSDIVEQASRDANADLIIMHPSVSDPTDFKGMPALVKDLAEFLPYGDLRRLATATKPTICFIDDIGQAPGAVQAALMQLIQARQINGVKISDKVTFCGATNDSTHLAGVSSIIEPVKSRWHTIVELEADLKDWKKWALHNDMPPELIAFLDLKPELLSDFKPTRDLTNSPSPRTVAAVGGWLKVGITDYEVLAGAVGQGFAVEFTSFLKVWHTIPDISAITTDPNNAPLPSSPATKFAICSMLTHHATKQNITPFITYLYRIGAEWQMRAVKDFIIKDPNLAETSAFIDWASTNAPALA